MNHFLLDEDEGTSSVATKGPRKRIGEVEEESRRRIYPRLLHKEVRESENMSTLITGKKLLFTWRNCSGKTLFVIKGTADMAFQL